MSGLHTQLKEALLPLCNDPLPQSEAGSSEIELQTRIQSVWKPIWEEIQAASSTSAAAEKRVDIVRSVLELLGREIVLTPVVDGELVEPDEDDTPGRAEFIGAISYRLDIVLALYEVVYTSIPDAAQLEPGALFIPLLEDLVELLSVEIWRDLWTYVETRSKRFTKNMPASRGKALPLLRIINAFLRFLPRTPEDLVFRGRVHQFASSVISVADKSAINMRGDYNDIKTTWEEEAKEEQGDEGDIDMDKTDKKEEPEEPNFYSTLWSLQQYFSNPPSLDGSSTGNPPISPFAQFKAKTDFVLPKLFDQTLKEKATAGIESTSPSRKRKRYSSDEQTGFFHPRYLTGKRLLSHELADPSFRRQILVQYFILFQFLLNLTPASAAKQAFTGGMPKTFVVGPEDQDWVKKKVQSIREEMRKMGRDGKSFENTVLSVITRERHYAQWKNDGCPESVFDVPPLQDDSAKKAAEGWKKHCAPPPRFPFKLGSRPLSLLWRNGFENIDQLKGWKRSSTVAGLDEELRQIEEGEEDDKAMGKVPSEDEVAASKELKIKNTWRGLRLASHTHIRHFSACKDKRDLHRLVSAIKADEAGPARNTPRSGRGATEEGDKGVDEAEVKVEEVAETLTIEGDKSKAVPDVEMTSA